MDRISNLAIDFGLFALDNEPGTTAHDVGSLVQMEVHDDNSRQRSKRQAWTEEDNLSIVHQVEKLRKQPAKVKVGTHSHKAITGQISRLRAQGRITLRFAKRTKPAENFTTSQIALIRQHTKEATKGARQSAAKLVLLPQLCRHTRESIATVIKKYGFADPALSQLHRLVHVLTRKEKQQIVKYLRNEGSFWPTPKVAAYFGCSEGQVKRLRNKHRLQVVHSEKAMSDSVYRLWYEARTANRTASLNSPEGAFARRLRRVKKELLQIRDEIWRGRKEREQKRCRVCGDYFPPTIRFFRNWKRKCANGQKYVLLSFRCQGCPLRAKSVYAE